jgi:3-oxoacyl-[acyl-carrier protein] reductase
MKLKSKVVMITGGSQGLGLSLAKKIAKEGSKLILIAQREELLKKAKKDVELEGGEVFFYSCDIRDLIQVKAVVGEIIKKYKNIDILINNAGIWTDNDLDSKDSDRRLETLRTNILGHIQFTEEVLPYLNNEESIIFNTISSAGVPDIPSGSNTKWRTYGASKMGMVGYTNALRESLRDTNTKVIQFFPGGFESNLYENAGRPNPHAQPWMMKTEDVADVALFTLTRPKDVYMEKIVVTKK